MYLKSLEIFGFKSFPEKITLKFDPNINVIVGPNGCGKSNIFDAIKWALGEQSPKSLRGTKMEDVIFNGTENYPPLSYTEVTLVFSNEDRYLPIDYKEVAITRKLYRSGESEYYLNKNQMRLKDIEELFMGTGIGEFTYSFVEQGKIEALLSYKPEEKRLILDEASGIIKYKERKKETLRKLEETDNNIARLDDIITEVKRQIRYLEKQVDKAQQYKETNEKLIVIEKKISALKLNKLAKHKESLLEELQNITREEEEKDKLLKEISSRIDTFNQEINELKDKVEEINMNIVNSKSYVDSSYQHININMQRISEIEERFIYLDKLNNDLTASLNTNRERVNKEKELFDKLVGNYNSIEQSIDQLNIKREESLKSINLAEGKIRSFKETILEKEALRVNITNNLIEINTNIQNISAHRKRLVLDLAKIDTYLVDYKEKVSQADSVILQINENIKKMLVQRDVLKKRLEEIDNQLKDLEEQAIRYEKELVELNSYRGLVKELEIKYDTLPLNKNVTIVIEWDKDMDSQKIGTLIANLNNAEIKEDIASDGKRIFKIETQAKILSLKEQDIEEKIKALQEDIIKIRNEIDTLRREREEKLNSISNLNDMVLDEEKNLSDYSKDKQNLYEEFNRIQEEKAILEEDIKGATLDLERLEQEKKRMEDDLENLKRELNDIQKNIEDEQRQIALEYENIKNIDIEITRKNTEKSVFQEQKDSYFAKLSLLEEEFNNINKRLEEINKEKEDGKTKISKLREEIENINRNIEEYKIKINMYEEERDVIREREKERREEVERLDNERSVLKDKIDKIREESYNKRIELQNIEFEEKRIKDYLKQVYNVDFIMEEVVIEEESNYHDLEKIRDSLKAKIESLGEVNLVAIEEFEELNKRMEFLNKQREDLLSSKENLKRAIQKINKTSREVFLDVFTKVEANFKELFRYLFGGGRANLILLDQENVLESGIEIEVQPPGKKLQSVSLLSGGEKALTAVALIFAIFKVRPSPLCILDEIDAPLDESNVDRFNRLLKDFSNTSQFIIITHNKLTMSSADILYGVTMQERGVSKLVSVKFAETQNEYN